MYANKYITRTVGYCGDSQLLYDFQIREKNKRVRKRAKLVIKYGGGQ